MGLLRQRWLAIVAVVGSLAFVACGGDDDGDEAAGGRQGEPRSVQLGFAVKNDMANAPLVIADEQGIYDDYGLNAELVYFDGGGALVQAMAGGQVGYGWVSHAPVIKAIEGGAPLKIIGEVNETAIGWGLVVPPDSPIRDVKDLERGMNVSYTSEGALTHWYALYSADQAGLDQDAIKGVPIGTSLPTIRTALDRGQIDAATVLLPWGDILDREGDARWVARMDEQLPEFSFTGIPATEDAIEDEQATSCLLGAYTAAVRWMDENPEETQRFFREFYDVEASLARSAYERLVPDFNETGQMDPKRMQFVIDEMKAVPGFIEGSVSADDVLAQAPAGSREECSTGAQ